MLLIQQITLWSHLHFTYQVSVRVFYQAFVNRTDDKFHRIYSFPLENETVLTKRHSLATQLQERIRPLVPEIRFHFSNWQSYVLLTKIKWDAEGMPIKYKNELFSR